MATLAAMAASPAPSLAKVFRPVDPLAEALHGLRMQGTFYCLSQFSEPWGLELPPMPGTLMFHIVTAGHCRLTLEGAQSMELRASDVVMVPHGRGHGLRGLAEARMAALFDLPREELGERYEVLRHGGGGAETAMVCGAVQFNDPLAQRLIKQFPPLMSIEAADHANPWIHAPIRSWLERPEAPGTGWLGALRDPLIGRSLAMMGEPPMHYLRTWRMQVATQRLRQGATSVGDVAEQLG